jgi:DNA-binding NtrC family response regulator
VIDARRELLWLRRVRDLSDRLVVERDLGALLDAIVDAALELSDAERAFLVLVEPAPGRDKPAFRVRSARGFSPADLRGEGGRASRRVVERVALEGRELLTARDGDASLLAASSLAGPGVRAVVGVPLRLRGQILGALYLDARGASAFTEQDLPILNSFAGQAALALDALQGADPLPASATGFDGEGSASRALRELLVRVARSGEPVLIEGESGVGKELAARELHRLGAPTDSPFVPVGCATLQGDLAESELFGHVRGAFTGATAAREGLFVAAGEGSLLLDEVTDLDLRLQAKLLRALQERVVRPVGAAAPVPIRCRILATSRTPLRDAVAAGQLREDLSYRLDVLRVRVPPLRERIDDLPALVAALGRLLDPAPVFTPGAFEALGRWRWPGNVRELANELRRLSAVGAARVRASDLSAEIREGRGVADPPVAGAATIPAMERAMVQAALEATGGNKSQAARKLGIPRTSLYRLLERYGLS